MISLGGSLAFWLTYREAALRKDAGVWLALAAVVFAAGLVGARGLSWLVHRPLYAEASWWSFLSVWDRGGMALYGGLALAAAAGFAYARYRGLVVGEAGDALVTAWLPFLVFVRGGCFLNGCCYGRPTTSPLGLVAGGAPNAVNFGVPSHPAQLYDAMALLAISGLVWWMRPRRRYAGQLTVIFLGLHSAFRIFHETLRGDPRLAFEVGGFGTLTFNQLVALGLLAFAVGAHGILARGGARTLPSPADP
jgi:phosphatidylglycerol:prolipoprotein diacylglycerol transferase